MSTKSYISILRNCLIIAILFAISNVYADSDVTLTSTDIHVNLEITPTLTSPAARTETPPMIQNLLQYAISHKGTEYIRGGFHPEAGFDCSGFVRHVFDHIGGVKLPHSANALSKLGSLVNKAELQPGDLVFFRRIKKTITHVGIYMGDNRFIHSSSKQSGGVIESSVLEKYWAKHFLFGRRLDIALSAN